MLTRTTELAINALVILGLEGGGAPMTPKQLAARLSCSPSYLGKTLGHLARAGILRSVRGAHGGVLLGRAPEDITLLAAVEATQGLMIASYCRDLEDAQASPCAYHQAMEEVFRATVGVLSRWTLADLLERPVGVNVGPAEACKMAFAGCELYEGWCRDAAKG